MLSKRTDWFKQNFVKSFVAISLLGFAFLMLPSVYQAQASATVNDGHGKEWMQFANATGRSWNQIAQNCPQDGVMNCTSAYNEWVWATDTQVLELLSYYEPAMATSRGVSGQAYFFTAETFFSAFRPTFSFCGTYQCGAFGSGWTATKDVAGNPQVGYVSQDNTNVSIDGSFGVGPVTNPDEISNFRGIWLWRATGPGAKAYNDAGQVSSPLGGMAVANVLANDWVNGVRATSSNAFITQISSTHPNISLNVTTGSVNVASITPAGTYSLVYNMCEIINPTNCDDATVSVTVRPFVVDAVNDAGWASPSTGGTAVSNVLANDTLSVTTAATNANVTLSFVSVSPSTSGVSLNANNGSVNVAAGTSVGTYSLVYQICDRTNLSSCDQATAVITVRSYVIDAVNDYVRASSKVGSSPLNVLTNDTFNGTQATTAQVQVTNLSAPIAGISLNTSTGLITIANKTSSGIYNINYKICEINAPTNCDTATATIELSGK
jgi:hypothetical protein